MLLVRPRPCGSRQRRRDVLEAVVLDRTVAGVLQEYALRSRPVVVGGRGSTLGQKRFNVGEVVGVAFDPAAPLLRGGGRGRDRLAMTARWIRHWSGVLTLGLLVIIFIAFPLAQLLIAALASGVFSFSLIARRSRARWPGRRCGERPG